MKHEKPKRILVIDNYDSFTYNLVQYLGELGAHPIVYRNTKITIKEAEKKKPDAIVISPGPCTPREAGVSNDIIRTFSGKLPILGVCLGHQCLGHVFGGDVVRAGRIMHGKTSMIHHTQDPLFKGVENPFQATRYHSLIIKRSSIPKDLKIIAWTDRGEIMGVKHRQHPTWGVQFHPESIMTPAGHKILGNFLSLIRT
jgi:anthranilate synthase/aminodeoxychorismate synthase-like glutamine amidotransferase